MITVQNVLDNQRGKKIVKNRIREYIITLFDNTFFNFIISTVKLAVLFYFYDRKYFK